MKGVGDNCHPSEATRDLLLLAARAKADCLIWCRERDALAPVPRATKSRSFVASLLGTSLTSGDALRRGRRNVGWGLRLDTHAVERPVDEKERREEEEARQHQRELHTARVCQRNRKFHREEAKQRRELDDRVHRDR